MRPDLYILNPVTKVAEPIEMWRDGQLDTAALLKWGTNFENKKLRRVANTNLWSGRVSISTVFLSLDNSSGVGRPILFETMICGGGKIDGETWRCSTWEEAEAQHRDAVIYVRRLIKRPDKLLLPNRRQRLRQRRLQRKHMRDAVQDMRDTVQALRR